MISPFRFGKDLKMIDATIIRISTEDIPEKFYNKTYAYFSFSVMNDMPVHLHLIDSLENPSLIAIIDLRGLDISARNKFYKFLQTIRVRNTSGLGMDLDLRYAKRKFGVNVKTTIRKE